MKRALSASIASGYGAARGLRNLGLGLIALAGAAWAEPVTVAAFGDSLTQGYGLPADQGFVPQLQDWLQAEGIEATVLNAGVSGDTTAGGLSRIDWTLTPDVDAMIVELGGNDFLRGLDPAESRENLRGILTAAREAGVEVLLVGLKVSTNYGPDYKADFEGMYTDLAAEFGTMLYPDFFTALMAGGDIAASRATYLQQDGTHPNAKGVALIVQDIGPEVAALIARVEG